MASVTPDLYREPRGKLSGIVEILFGLLFIPVGHYLLPRSDLLFLMGLGLWCAISGFAEVLPSEQTIWAGRIRIFAWVVMLSIFGGGLLYPFFF